MSNYISDTPLVDIEKDKFSRKEFAKRIGETINNFHTPECLVMGINGEWGEGKSTILNFIVEFLKNEKNIVIVRFNPWQYSNESKRNLAFFNLLSKALSKSLKTKREIVGEIIKEYAEWLSDIGNLFGYDIGRIPNNIGEKLSKVDIEELKKRLENILEENKKRLLIIVDDIDRLYNEEIQSIFRLIKLTADFKHTTYILAFDRKLVAEAISENFGGKSREDGFKFLEKIVQIPIDLPKISIKDLRDFCFERIDIALTQNEIQLIDSDRGRFINLFSSYILPRLNNPRLAIRYGNALTFSLPLVYGEVNTIDFMLIQAIKVFYPKIYLLIEKYPGIFITTPNRDVNYKSVFSEEKLPDTPKNIIEGALEEYEYIHRKNLKNLLTELFPVLQTSFSKTIFSEQMYNKWYYQKRIGSPLYFSRYFSLTVPKDEISDVFFEEFLKAVQISPNSNLTEDFYKQIENNKLTDSFISKVRRIEKLIDEELSYNLALFINGIAKDLSTEKRFLMMSSFSQAAIAVRSLILNQYNYKDKEKLFLEIANNSTSLGFLAEIIMWLTPEDSETYISEEVIRKGVEVLIKKIKNQKLNIYSEVSGFSSLITSLWYSYSDKDNLENYIKEIIDRDSKYAIIIIRNLMPTTSSTSRKEPYKSYLRKDTFANIVKYVSSNYLKNKLIEYYGSELKGKYKYQEYMDSFSERETASQFLYLCENFKEFEKE